MVSAMAEQIIVVVAKDGTTTVEGAGFSGPACDKVIREMAEALGTVEEVTKLPEFFRGQAQAERRNA
jgi:hypothetical protein